MYSVKILHMEALGADGKTSMSDNIDLHLIGGIYIWQAGR